MLLGELPWLLGRVCGTRMSSDRELRSKNRGISDTGAVVGCWCNGLQTRLVRAWIRCWRVCYCDRRILVVVRSPTTLRSFCWL